MAKRFKKVSKKRSSKQKIILKASPVLPKIGQCLGRFSHCSTPCPLNFWELYQILFGKLKEDNKVKAWQKGLKK